MAEIVIRLSEDCTADIKIGDTLTIGEDERHWFVTDVDGDEITIVQAQVR